MTTITELPTASKSPAPAQHPSSDPVFDARAWLDHFMAVGGSIHPTTIGVQLYGRPISDQQTARALIDEIEQNPARMAAVRVLANHGPMIGGVA